MSKLKHLYNEEIFLLVKQAHQKWGDNVLKVCPSIQWSLFVWPDLAKFCHFDKSLQVFGKFLKVNILFGKMLSLFWRICEIVGLIFCVSNGQILKNNLTIWSHCLCSRPSPTRRCLLRLLRGREDRVLEVVERQRRGKHRDGVHSLRLVDQQSRYNKNFQPHLLIEKA